MNGIEYKSIPDYIDEPMNTDEINDCTLIELMKQSDAFYDQFAAILTLTKYDKLCINDNKLCIQKLSPWRYFVRKYKKQNSSTLALYLQTEIIEYEYFIHKVCRVCNNYPESQELCKVAEKHYSFIQHSSSIMTFLRDKHNVRPNSKDISVALEMWCLKLTKMKPALMNIISKLLNNCLNK